MTCSGSASNRTSSMRSVAENPRSAASRIMWPFPTSRVLASLGHKRLNSQISCFTEVAESVRVGMVSSRSHRHT
jgi:hypothetical protein